MAGWSEGGEWGMVGNDVRGAIGHGEEFPLLGVRWEPWESLGQGSDVI